MNIIKKVLLMLLILTFTFPLFSQERKSYRFDFGPGKAAKNFIKILAGQTYGKPEQYGFDFNTVVSNQYKGGKNTQVDGYVFSDKPFYFSVDLPEGNYLVTLTLGDDKKPTNTTIKAESRRLMFENIQTQAGQYLSKSFVVNVKSRNINGNEVVKLKPRELHKLDWDNKLSLEFDGQTALSALEIEPVNQQTTIFLAGNSTVVNQDDEPWAAWGQMIPRFFKPGLAIANHAESGLTLGTFMASKRLDKILSVLQSGDYVFIEFGHNDQKEKGPQDGAYQSYTERLKIFITKVKEKQGIPVILTSTCRRAFGPNGKLVNTLGDYPAAARKVAEENKVTLIDLNALTERLFNAMGEENSKRAFVHYPANSYPGQTLALADNTHFNPYGAYEIAKCIVAEIKNQNLPLAKYIVDDFKGFDPEKPDDLKDWHWPESPKSSVLKPDGN